MSAETIQEERLEIEARDALRDLPLPSEIQGITFAPGEDASGESVLRVTLTVRPGEMNQQSLRTVVNAMYEVQRRLLASNIDRFPHVSLEQAA